MPLCAGIRQNTGIEALKFVIHPRKGLYGEIIKKGRALYPRGNLTEHPVIHGKEHQNNSGSSLSAIG